MPKRNSHFDVNKYSVQPDGPPCMYLPVFCGLRLFEELSEFPDAADVRLVAVRTHRQCQNPFRPVQMRRAIAHVAEHELELCHLLGRKARRSIDHVHNLLVDGQLQLALSFIFSMGSRGERRLR